MDQENQTPGSLKELKQHFFKKIWNWIIVKSAGYKIAFGVGCIILLVVAARLNFFGEPYFKYARLIIPMHIPCVDEEAPSIPLILSYEIEDKRGRRTGKLGDTCYSGDRIYISLKAGEPSWITVFGVDSKRKPFPIHKQKLNPDFMVADKYYTYHFTLDHTIGSEVYYAIAAPEEFNFEENIRPSLDDVFSKIGSKGPVFSEYQLELPDKFTQEFIYFRHLSQK